MIHICYQGDWLCHPLLSLPQIEKRLDVVEALCSCPAVRRSLHENLLRRMPDIGLLTRKLEQGKATLSDCYRLYQMVILIKRISPLLSSMKTSVTERIFASINELILEKVQKSIVDLRPFAQLIENTLDFDYSEQNGQHGIQPNIDPRLQEISKKIDGMNEEAQNLRRKMADNAKCEQELTKIVISTCAGYIPALKLFDDCIGVLDVLTAFSLRQLLMFDQKSLKK
uniref:DNA mismatch repair protein MutS core domain-containing protein n=1 Tax=Meloidogyne javanica TaxID=6303 RepID=A0A915LRB3_MELJA